MLRQELLREVPELKRFVSIFTGYGKNIFTLFLIIGSITEIIKSLSGKGDVGGKLTMSLIIAVSLSAFNAYQSDLISVGFSISEEVLKIGKVDKTLDFIFDNTTTKQTNLYGSEKIKSNYGNSGTLNKVDIGEITMLSKNNMNVVKSLFNSIPLGLTWLTSKSIIVINRSIYSILYNLFIVLGPLIAWLALLSGWESSIKAFWQTFMFFILAPIIFSLTYVISFYVIFAPSSSEPLPVDTLINTIVCAIMLLGSFVTTAYIVTSKPITSFAEQASMMGAMALATSGVMMAKTTATRASNATGNLAKNVIDKHINPRIANMLGSSDPTNKKFIVPGSRIDDISRNPKNPFHQKTPNNIGSNDFKNSRGTVDRISPQTNKNTTSKNILSSTSSNVKSALNNFKENRAEKRMLNNMAKDRAIRIKNNKFIAKPANLSNISDASNRVGKIKKSYESQLSLAPEKRNISDHGRKVGKIKSSNKFNGDNQNFHKSNYGVKNEKSVH